MVCYFLGVYVTNRTLQLAAWRYKISLLAMKKCHNLHVAQNFFNSPQKFCISVQQCYQYLYIISYINLYQLENTISRIHSDCEINSDNFPWTYSHFPSHSHTFSSVISLAIQRKWMIFSSPIASLWKVYLKASTSHKNLVIASKYP